MQAQALSSRMNMNRPIPVQRLVTDISDSISFITFCTLVYIIFLEAQVNTQQYGGRPFGVGLLIAGIDVNSFLLFYVLIFSRKLGLICLNSHPQASSMITSQCLLVLVVKVPVHIWKNMLMNLKAVRTYCFFELI
jgi:hypothetical protein